METKENRQIKRGFGILGRAIGKKYASPEQQQEDVLFSTEMRARQRMEAAIRGAPTELLIKSVVEKFKDMTPKEVDEKLLLIKRECAKQYEKEQEIKKQSQKEAQKSLEFQKQPFYRICLGGCYGVFGSFVGETGPSQTGLKFAEEVKRMDTETLRQAVKKLKEGDLRGYPLANYDREYIQRVIDWLMSEIVTRESKSN